MQPTSIDAVNGIYKQEHVQTVLEKSANYMLASLGLAVADQMENTTGMLASTMQGSHQDDAAQEAFEVLSEYSNNPYNWPALHYAIHCRDEHAVEILLKNGANPNLRTSSVKDKYGKPIPDLNCTPLELACGSSRDSLNPKIVDRLLHYGANPYVLNAFTFSPVGYVIHTFCDAYYTKNAEVKEKALEILNIFAAYNTDFNKNCINGHTPLWYALYNPYKSNELTRFLLLHGAQVNDA